MAERAPGDHRFLREARVRRRVDFRAIQSRGARVHTAHFIVVVEASAHDATRLGITVTRRIGSAVRRNRVKRLVRETFRRHRDAFPTGCDVVVIAKPGAETLAFRDVEDELVRASGAMAKAAARARRAREERP